MKKVTIAGKAWNFGFFSIWGPLYAYEVLQGQIGLPDFDARKNLCRHVLFWLILKDQNPEFELSFEAFTKELNNLQLVKELETIYGELMASMQLPASEGEVETGKKSKKK